MQTKKDEVNIKILDSATDEFYEKGFNSASMRTIAKNAEMTPGNLYSYYKGKQELLSAILAGPSEAISAFIEGIHKGIKMDETSLSDIGASIADIFIRFKKPFMILMHGSGGTAFDGFRNILTNAIADRLKKDYFSLKDVEYDDFLPKAAAGALLEGLLEIFSKYTDDETALRRTTEEFLNLMFSDIYYGV